MIENLTLIRNILFKWFIIGIAYYLLVVLIYIFCKEFYADMMDTLFLIEPEESYELMVSFIAMIKISLILLGLFPVLALHWTIKTLPDKEENK